MTISKNRISRALFIIVLIIISIVLVITYNKVKDIHNTFDISNNYNDTFSDKYTDEIISMEEINAENIKNYNNKIVGFCLNKSSEESFLFIKEKLESKNWVCIPSNNNIYASFSKKYGEYQWLFLSCTQINEHLTSVVITID